MAINERLIDTAVVSGCSAEPTEEGLQLHLDANDVDSYDGDGDEWIDITNHEYTPTTNVSEHFNTVLYPGNGGTKEVTGVGFQPDLVWIKRKNGAGDPGMVDVIRGNNSALFTNSQTAESALTGGNISMDLDGFDINTYGSTWANLSGGEYVAWCFKAGGAPNGSDTVSIDGTSYATMSAAGLTDGTIAVDKLSVNSDLGFSVIQLDNKVTHPDKTIAHGLGVSPEMIIWKRTDSTGHWYVYHKGIGKAKHIILNSQAAAVSTPDWVESTPNSTTFDVSWSSNSRDYIAYCFASKRGVSKVGSYTGTGASNKVYTGFEPAFIIGKCTSNSPTNWWIFDNKRGDEVLYPNLLDDEDLLSDYVSFDRDGFTLSNAAFVNQSGRDYIYYAVAKNTNETSLIPDTDLELGLDAGTYSGSGDWLDSSGNGNNGTITGATWEEELGNSFEFDGSTGVVTLTDNIVGTDGIATTEVWAKGSSFTSPNGNDILYENAGGNSFFYGIYTTSTGLTVRVANTNNSVQTDVSYALSNFNANDWYHIAATFSGASNPVKLYVNGELVNQANAQSTLRILNVGNYIGGEGSTVSLRWAGQIGQVRTYTSTLTQAQIRQNYNFTKPNYPNGYDGTITGATWNSGGYFDFDGSDDYVTNNDLSLDTSKHFTFCGWVYPTADLTWQRMFSWGTSSTEVTVQKRGDNNKARIIARVSNSIKFDVDGAVLTNNQWHFIAVTGDGSDVKMYVNDNAAVTDNIAGTNNYNNLQLGTGAGTTEDFYGRISKFKLYDKVLTQTEIDNLYCEGE